MMWQKLFPAFFCFCWLLLAVVQLTETRSMTHHSPGEEEETVHLPSMNGDDHIKESEGADDENNYHAIIRASKRSTKVEELTPSSTGISLMWKEIISSMSLVIQKLVQPLYDILKRFFDPYLQSIVSLVRDRFLSVWLFFSSYVLQHPIVRSALTNYSSSSSLQWRPIATALFETLVKLQQL